MSSDTDLPALPVDAVDRLLSQLSAHVHDKPVQALVAAKMMTESASATSGELAETLRARGQAALDRASAEARDVMWLLDRSLEVPDDLEVWRERLAEHLDRVGGDDGVAVALDRAATSDGAPSQPMSQDVRRAAGGLQLAVLDVSAAVLVVGGEVQRVEITADEITADEITAGGAMTDGTVMSATVHGRAALGTQLVAALLDLARARCTSVEVHGGEGHPADRAPDERPSFTVVLKVG